MTKEAAQQYKAEGNVAFQAQRYEDAVDLFSKAIAEDPTDHVLYSNRSGAYASMKDYAKALEDANKCIEIKPDWPKGYSRKGLAEHNLGHTVEAIEAYEAGLKLDPNNAALKDGLERAKAAGTSWAQSNQMEMALAASLMQDPKFAKYIQEDPQYVHKLLGIFKQITGATGQPPNVELLQGALAMAPVRIREGLSKLMGIPMDVSEEATAPTATPPSSAPPAAHSQQQTASKPAAEPEKPSEEQQAEEFKRQGNKAYTEKKFEEALALYDKALELCPTEILYVNNKAAVYLEMGDYEKCIKTCEEALELPRAGETAFSKVAKVYGRMAACYRRQRKYDEAIKMYQKALCEDSDRHIRAALRDCEREFEKWQAEQYINPELAEELRLKGNELFKNKDYPAAKQTYDDAIKRNPKDARLYGNRAAAYMQLLEYPSALRDAEKALELDPKFVKAWARKGTCHLKMRDHNKALTAYQEGLKIDPENEECRNGMNQTLMAVQQMQRSSEADPEQIERAMADPEIQQILSDPQFRLILEQLQQDPSRLTEFARDPKIAEGIQKLMVAGILRTA